MGEGGKDRKESFPIDLLHFLRLEPRISTTYFFKFNKEFLKEKEKERPFQTEVTLGLSDSKVTIVVR